MYGTVEDVGIKVLGDSNAAYSFILYQVGELFKKQKSEGQKREAVWHEPEPKAKRPQ